jgi:anion-transporting  ArsA/GET3 family ATPase
MHHFLGLLLFYYRKLLDNVCTAEPQYTIMSANQTQVEAADDSTPVEIVKALESYQVVLDIFSLRGICSGYPIYCRDWTFDEFTRMTLKGIHAALIGDFKVGKTFLTGKLLDLPTPADQVLQTPGICVATKSFTVKQNSQAPVSAAKRGFKKTVVKTSAVVSTPSAASSASSSISNVKEFDFILMDTAGTDMPTSMHTLKDTRATEVFLRSLILNLSDRVIFVTNKFDRPTQEKLVNLIKQLKKARKEVSSQRRVLVVHNLSSVHHKVVLQEKIALVEGCYTTQDPTLSVEDDEGADVSQVAWATKQYDGITVYDTSLVTHFFLVNDTAADTDDFKPREYNALVIKALKNKLYETNPVQQPMLLNLIKFAREQLTYFLEGWSQNHYLVPIVSEDNTKNGGILPYKLPGDGDTLLNDFFLNPKLKEALEPVEIDHWPLTRMRFVDSGVMSETVQELQGTWFVDKNKNKFIIYIRAPGFSASKRNQSNMRFVWDRIENWVEVHVKLDMPVAKPGFEIGGPAPRIRDARGVHRCNFPEDERYLLPVNPKFYEEDVQVQDGEIWITLGMEFVMEFDDTVSGGVKG